MNNWNARQWVKPKKAPKSSTAAIDESTAALKFVYETILYRTLDVPSSASAEATLETKVAARNPKTDTDTIDLIDHSADGVLGFGDWTVDQFDWGVGAAPPPWVSTDSKQPAPTNLRLLGCSTSITAAGAAAMIALQTQLKLLGANVTIWGTTVPLYGDDFDENGLKASKNVVTKKPHVLLPSSKVIVAEAERFEDHGKKAAPITETILPDETTHLEQVRQWFERFIPEGRTRAEVEADIVRLPKPIEANATWVQRIEPSATLAELIAPYSKDTARAPGLLALPSLELFVPVRSGAHEYARVQYFFNGHMIRVFPCDAADGVLLYRTTASLPTIGSALPPMSTHLAP